MLSSHSALVGQNAQLAFHYAYALYRDKQHTKALDELRKRGTANLTEGEQHLLAQANYRAGHYQAAAKVYNTHFAADEDVELQANMLAALVSADLLDEAKAYIKKLGIMTAPPSFELAYNAACCFIECGDYTSALTVLRKAQTLCRDMLEEDGLTDAEIENELSVMYVQEGFILQSLSKTAQADGTENERALAIYTKILTQHPTDPNVLSVASNNVITLRTGSGRVWDSLKKSSKAIGNLDLKDMTLSARQKSAIQLNRALALFHGKQYDKARDLLVALVKEFPSNVQQSIALAAVLAKDKARMKEAEEVFNTYLKTQSETAPIESVQAVYLGLTHLALMKNDFVQAAQVLSTLVESAKFGANLRHRPGVVATQVALFEKAGQLDGAHRVIQAAVDYWKSEATKSSDGSRLFTIILSGASTWYNRHGREADAAILLELLAAQTSSSKIPSDGSASSRAESLARLVLAYRGDMTKAEKFVAQLPELKVDGYDIHKLETEPAPEQKLRQKKAKKVDPTTGSSSTPSASGASNVSVKDIEEDDDDGEDDTEHDAAQPTSASLAKSEARKALKAKQKKKKHVPRYPKGFDPANPGPMPDPERWLPRWERSNQRKYNKRRNAGNAIRGAQGSTNMAQMPTKELESSSDAIESKGKVSGAAAAAARKRAGKKR